ncbi:MAG: UPF0149 family protein [Deltaproteobacteria bacterium]|nr:UPF0149 family protein [Deltaproteobacteria bacterium]
MKNLADGGPLSDRELEELEQFLLETEGLEDAMDVSMLDGFLTSIACGQRAVLPSEWMPWVWDLGRGEAEPPFEDQRQANRILSLVMRHLNGIALTLTHTPEEYEPLLMEADGAEPVVIVDEWCVGFGKGMSLDARGWSQAPASARDGLEKIRQQQASAGELAATVREVHAHFLVQRLEAPALAVGGGSQEPERRTDRVGRNDACPCGSGKKYKRCHGSGA